jgi:hypothetical protein
MTPKPVIVQPVEWPTVKVGSEVVYFALTFAAHFLLQKWGLQIGKASDFEIAAACAGTIVNGVRKSLGLTPLEFADMLANVGDPELPGQVIAAAVHAAKKVYPDVVVLPPPASGTTESSQKTDGSESGPLASQNVA